MGLAAYKGSLMNRFPSYSKFPSDLLNLRWLLSPESAVAFEFSWNLLVAQPFRKGLAEISSWSAIRFDLKVLVASLIVKKIEKFIAIQLYQQMNLQTDYFQVEFENPRSMYEQEIETVKVDIPVPTMKELAGQTFAVLASHAVVYPLTTVVMRFAAKEIDTGDFIQLFSTSKNFLQLYKGIEYHLAWTLAYQICTSATEWCAFYFQHSRQKEEQRPFVSIMCQLGISILSMAGYPLQVKALLDQVYPETQTPFSWRMPGLRYYIFSVQEVFKK